MWKERSSESRQHHEPVKPPEGPDRHPDLYAEASPKVAKKSATAASSANENRQPALLQSIKQSAKYGGHSSIAQELNRTVTYFLAKDMQPMYTN